jgi:hypothetical protein
MTLMVGTSYSREDIAAELHLGGGDSHAVLVRQGKAVAVVVNESGRNPFNGKQYKNDLRKTTFTMQGENDDRGELLEDATNLVHLFFRRNDEAEYRYEGRIRFKPPVGKWAIRNFDIIT